jgi:hypothetical protein
MTQMLLRFGRPTGSCQAWLGLFICLLKILLFIYHLSIFTELKYLHHDTKVFTFDQQWGSLFPPATLDDDGVKLCLSYMVPPPPPGDIEASMPTIIGATPVAVDAAADNEGFTPVSRTMGFKTTYTPLPSDGHNHGVFNNLTC